MRRPIVALLTDFGTADYYVASMKAVVLGLCPTATLVDVSHEVPPQDVVAGALLLESCWRDFPRGTVFLAVVDPGVGTARRALAAEGGGRRFVGPDNGVFSLVWSGVPDLRVVSLPPAGRRRAGVGIGGMSGAPSRTFEGRDRFAPAAARLAGGLRLDALGPRVIRPRSVALPRVVVTPRRMVGEVVLLDRFGNLVTNLQEAEVARWAGGRDVRVGVGRRAFGRPVRTYADVEPGRACVLAGSTGRLEIAVRDGSAAATLGVGRGTKVAVTCW